jgi:hypothetical protein
MKIIFDDPLKVIAAEMGPAAMSESLDEHRQMLELGGRIVKYGIPVFASLALWLWIVYPDLGLPKTKQLLPFLSFFVLLGLAVLLYEVAHELVHLIAMPTRLLRPDTRLFIYNIKSVFTFNMAVRPGGALTREQFIWISALPLLLLTVLPFVWAILADSKPNIIIGLVACLNFSGAVGDMLQIREVLQKNKFGELLPGFR